jgi:hypothetical protein
MRVFISKNLSLDVDTRNKVIYIDGYSVSLPYEDIIKKPNFIRIKLFSVALPSLEIDISRLVTKIYLKSDDGLVISYIIPLNNSSILEEIFILCKDFQKIETIFPSNKQEESRLQRFLENIFHYLEFLCISKEFYFS